MTKAERRELLAIVRSWKGWKQRHLLHGGNLCAGIYHSCIVDMEKFLKESKKGKYDSN